MARVRDFLRMESSAGIVLIFAALLALIASNSVFSDGYTGLITQPLTIGLGAFALTKPALLWINDALMAVFFLLVGLEIKRELAEGALSSMSRAALPLIAAVGGMVGPVLVFLALNFNAPANLPGWAVPAATDIAFALGILVLMGARAPVQMKILLLAIAIIDDLGAISIIALFYTDTLAIEPLLYALACIGGLFALNRLKVGWLALYMLAGALLWVFVLKSGIHATLAGVVTAAFIPLRAGRKEPLHTLEHALHPWVAFLILPVFAFANAGISFDGLTLSALLTPLTAGIALGLVVGKQAGVFGAVWLAERLGWARRPDGVNWMQIYGLACLTGVGFTMSLFIGGLAFDDASRMVEVKLGVLTGSTVSAIMGVGILLAAGRPASKTAKPGRDRTPSAAKPSPSSKSLGGTA